MTHFLATLRANRGPGFAITASIVLLLVTPRAAGAQGQQAADPQELIAAVSQNHFWPSTLDQIARQHVVEAVPALRQRFEATGDPLTKQLVASALVRLGSPEDVYWDYLADRARAAVESQVPFPMAFDADGKAVRGQFSTAFREWARSVGVTPEAASVEQIQTRPTDVLLLAITGDPRGQSLLRQALSSPNYLINAYAASGLAKLVDRSAIPLIIGLCGNVPSEAAFSIAKALVFFNDPAADAAAALYIKNAAVLDELRRLSHTRGTEALF